MVRRGPLLVALCALAAAQDVDDDMGGDDGAGMDATGPSPPAADGVSASSCVFKAAGNRFDLSPMKRTDHDFTGTTTGGYTYRFNVCGNTQSIPGSGPRGLGSGCINTTGTFSAFATRVTAEAFFCPAPAELPDCMAMGSCDVSGVGLCVSCLVLSQHTQGHCGHVRALLLASGLCGLGLMAWGCTWG